MILLPLDIIIKPVASSMLARVSCYFDTFEIIKTAKCWKWWYDITKYLHVEGKVIHTTSNREASRNVLEAKDEGGINLQSPNEKNIKNFHMASNR